MDRFHQLLLARFSVYRDWHLISNYHAKHWLVFLAITFFAFTFIHDQIELDLLNTRAAIGTTYYVAPTGNDTNSGIEAQPFKTIQKCANVVVAGDTCLVMAGTYPERVRVVPPHSGQAGLSITFRAVPSRSVQMQGFYVTASHIMIQGFDISTSTTGWNGGGVWVAGSNLEILDNYFHDIPGPAVSFSWLSSWANGAPGLWHDIKIARNKVYRCNKGFSIMGRNVTVEDNDIERLVYSGEDADYMRFFGEYITIRRNYMHGTLQSEIGSSHTDGFQTFDNNGEFAQHILIEKNIVTDYFAEGFMGEANFYQNSFDITFRNNIFQGSIAWGLAITDGLKDVKVYNNVFANIAIHGVGVTSGAQAEVYNNIFYNAGSNYWADTTSTLTARGYNIISQPHYPNYQAPTDLVSVDPKFVDPARLLGSDGVPFTVDDGFHLQSSSPAIDAGISLGASGMTDDLDGVTRPQLAGWDIGAYEFISGAVATPSPTVSGSPAPSPSTSPSITPTSTLTPTPSPSPTITPSPTPSTTISVSPAPSPSITPTPTPIVISTKFKLGDRVRVSRKLNVRSSPSLTGVILGTQPKNALGTIISGPISANGYIWYQVNYDNVPDGWSVQNYLRKL